MPAGIFLVRGDNELFELSAQPYPQEDLLQELLARYPNLLAGDQMNPSAPRRWLLVRREAPVPDALDGSGRWSLDHLFLDQDGVPTLVEVKRASDTRGRREVVAQMLDYAANGVAYWPVESLRASVEQRAVTDGRDPGALLVDLLGSESDAEIFWAKVKVNLQAGRVRMVFVSDEISPELRRIVEFLNVQMDPAEVLAVEVKQYVGADFRGLVPRLVGQTSEAMQRKSAGVPVARSEAWSDEAFFEALGQVSPDVVAAARDVANWLAARPDVELRGGRGVQTPTLNFYPRSGGVSFLSLRMEGEGKIMFTIQEMWRTQPDAAALRVEWVHRLNEVPGLDLADTDKYPSRDLSVLASDVARDKLKSAANWMLMMLAS